jgi:hypothetical protein
MRNMLINMIPCEPPQTIRATACRTNGDGGCVARFANDPLANSGRSAQPAPDCPTMAVTAGNP